MWSNSSTDQNIQCATEARHAEDKVYGPERNKTMKSKLTMVMVMALAVAFCTAMVVMAEDAAPVKQEGKGCATCPGCPKDKGEKKMALGERIMKQLEAVKPALTDEQKTKITELAAAAKKKIAEATEPKAKMEIAKEFHKTVMQTVLTAEQRTSLPKRHKGEGKGKCKDGETTTPAATTK